MKLSYTWKMTLFFSMYVTTNLIGHPTSLGRRNPLRARLQKSVLYTSLSPKVRKQAPLVALVTKLNQKK